MQNEMVLLDNYNYCLDAYTLNDDINDHTNMTVERLSTKYKLVCFTFNNIIKYDISLSFIDITSKYKILDRIFNDR